MFEYSLISITFTDANGNETELPASTSDTRINRPIHIDFPDLDRPIYRTRLFDSLRFELTVDFPRVFAAFALDFTQTALINLGGKWHEIPIAKRPDLN